MPKKEKRWKDLTHARELLLCMHAEAKTHLVRPSISTSEVEKLMVVLPAEHARPALVPHMPPKLACCGALGLRVEGLHPEI